jgi:Ca2+/Na+ antiporter
MYMYACIIIIYIYIYIYLYVIYVYYVFVKRNDRGTTVQNNHTINRTKLGEADMCFSLW